jgi:Resolvase, N terminal domain
MNARVAIYARVSTTNDGQDVRLQTGDLRELAEARGWRLADEYVDSGVSGSSKGGTGKFLAGQFDAVSGKVIDDSTREVSFMKGGKEMLQIRIASKDGKTARETVKGTNPQGKPVSGVLVWEKQ